MATLTSVKPMNFSSAPAINNNTTNDDGEENSDVEPVIDDFWDNPSSSASSSPLPSTPSLNSAIHRINLRPSAIVSSSTSFVPPFSTLTWSTLPPPFTNFFRTSETNLNDQSKLDTTTEKNEETSMNEILGHIWRMVLHGTNMNSEELKMSNHTIIRNHFKKYSRRKVARTMKKDLEKIFSEWNYRFSILVSSTSRNTMGKALHGVWMSVSINDVHYFITATHSVIEGPKIDEEQMEKIEYWAHVHAITTRNMTGFRKYNKIALKLKADLDRFYGNGNVWSVVIVKNPFLVKAKILEDPEYHLEFSRLNGGHFIVWRGGQNIEDGQRNARDLIIPETEDNLLEPETEHEDYRNNIYLMTYR
ncbi:hypothetical protein NH340_JMT03323 [Sarcoptes scabiei]|nr:hypothetical protein NH340_JMT03323 [Sarcoptes scabiei]